MTSKPWTLKPFGALAGGISPVVSSKANNLSQDGRQSGLYLVHRPIRNGVVAPGNPSYDRLILGKCFKVPVSGGDS